MTSLVGLLSLMPGVAIVRLRLDGRLRGGVGGLMKSGDGGAELFFSWIGWTAGAAGAWARRLVSEVVVLMPRFLDFVPSWRAWLGVPARRSCALATRRPRSLVSVL